jgi:type II secretory pathway component GspD/PulD (secretin)
MIRLSLFNLTMLLVMLAICAPYSHAEGERPLSKDPIVIKIIELDYTDAEHLASILAPLLSAQGHLIPHKATNTLIIKDRASVVKRLVEIIKGNCDP